MKSKPDIICQIRSAAPGLSERELYKLQTDELAGLLAATKAKWTPARIGQVWHFSPHPGAPDPGQ